MEYVCIVCPNGCRLTVEKTPDGVVVHGHRCPKGESYGRDEYLDPRRVVTAVVRTDDPDHPCAPVKSERPVARNDIMNVLQHLYGMRVTLPVHSGEVCAVDCCGTGISIVFTRTLLPRSTRSSP